MCAAPLLLGAARAMRGNSSSSGARVQTLLLSSSRHFASAQPPPPASDDHERRVAEASLFETGALNPRDYGYAHPHLEPAKMEQDSSGGGGGGIRLRVAPSAPAPVPLGSTLLLARPLALLDAPEDHQPSPAALSNLIAMKRLWQTPAAAVLQFDARPGPAAAATPLPAMGAAAAAAAAARPSARARAPLPPLADLAALPHWMLEPSPLDGRRDAVDVNDAAQSLVATNAYGDDEDDLPAAALRMMRRPREATGPAGAMAAAALGGRGDPHQGGGPRAVAGVWPAFALLNHSCAPTSVHYCVESTMVVRAAADLSPGDEATVSYLAREVFAPVDERRRVLSERYGFECACARCKAEEALPRAVRETAAAARKAVVERLRPRFEAAVEAGDGAVAAEVAAEVSALLKTLEGAMERELEGAAAAAEGGGGEGGEEQQQRGADGLAAQAVAYEAYELAYFASALAEASLGVGLEEAAAADDPGGGSIGGGAAPQLAEGEDAADRTRRAAAYRGARHAATAALARCALILDGVARGSEVHVLSAHALLRRATRQQRQAAAALAAGGGCSAKPNAEAAAAAADRMAEAAAAIVSGAHEARYGASSLPEEVALGLLEASKELADEYY